MQRVNNWADLQRIDLQWEKNSHTHIGSSHSNCGVEAWSQPKPNTIHIRNITRVVKCYLYVRYMN